MASPEILERLQKVALFKPILDSAQDVERLAEIVEMRKCKAGTRIIVEGDEGDEMFIINKGRVNVLKKTMYEDEYTVANLNAEMGAFFGEIGLMDADKRSATIVADTDCEFLVISRNRFIELGNQYPHLGLFVTREIARNLCGRLRQANQSIVTLFGALVQQVEEEMMQTEK
ncbi:MAG: Crp/Fnr family transcriptional regulator [Candidatus Xenobia bacterium]